MIVRLLLKRRMHFFLRDRQKNVKCKMFLKGHLTVLQWIFWKLNILGPLEIF
jgi:hypothetical protein